MRRRGLGAIIPLAHRLRRRQLILLVRGALAALMFVGLMSVTAVAHAEGLPQYRTLLVDLLAQAQAAERATPPLSTLAEHGPTKLALERLELVRTVDVGDNGAVPVEIDDIAAGLRGPREEGLKAIAALQITLSALDSPSSSGGDNALQVLDAVYESQELVGASNPIADFIQDIRQRLFRWLGELFAPFKLPFLPAVPLEREGEVLFWAIAVVVALFALASFAFAYLRLRNNMARYARTANPVSVIPIDAASARLAAERAAAIGDIRQAIQFLYRAAILHLTERALLSADRSLTNHELVAALASRPELAGLLGQTVDIFERTWYGHGECSAVDFQRFRSNVDRVLGAGP